MLIICCYGLVSCFLSVSHTTIGDIIIMDHDDNGKERVIKTSAAPKGHGLNPMVDFHCKTVLTDSRFYLRLLHSSFTGSFFSYCHLRPSAMTWSQEHIYTAGPRTIAQFLYWSVQINATLNARNVWQMVHACNARALSRPMRNEQRGPWGLICWAKQFKICKGCGLLFDTTGSSQGAVCVSWRYSTDLRRIRSFLHGKYYATTVQQGVWKVCVGVAKIYRLADAGNQGLLICHPWMHRLLKA